MRLSGLDVRTVTPSSPRLAHQTSPLLPRHWLVFHPICSLIYRIHVPGPLHRCSHSLVLRLLRLPRRRTLGLLESRVLPVTEIRDAKDGSSFLSILGKCFSGWYFPLDNEGMSPNVAGAVKGVVVVDDFDAVVLIIPGRYKVVLLIGNKVSEMSQHCIAVYRAY